MPLKYTTSTPPRRLRYPKTSFSHLLTKPTPLFSTLTSIAKADARSWAQARKWLTRYRTMPEKGKDAIVQANTRVEAAIHDLTTRRVWKRKPKRPKNKCLQTSTDLQLSFLKLRKVCTKLITNPRLPTQTRWLYLRSIWKKGMKAWTSFSRPTPISRTRQLPTSVNL